MTSFKAAAAIAVVAVIVIAAVAYVVLCDGGNSEDSTLANTIGPDIHEGDYHILFTLSDQILDVNSANDTRYTIINVNGDSLLVEEAMGDQTSQSWMSKQDFPDDVSVIDESFIGQYLRIKVIDTYTGQISCQAYYQSIQTNAGSVSVYEWIGVNTNIIYRTTIEINLNGTSDFYTTHLVRTNMTGGEVTGNVIIPGGLTGEVMTDLQAGDYIEFSKYDDGRDIDRFTLLQISGDNVLYREMRDDDIERTTVDRFLALVIYDGSGNYVSNETVKTPNGTVICNVYENYELIGSVLDFDWEDRVVVWASVDDGIIYKIESTKDYWYDDDCWHDWYDDVELYYLTSTSLIASSGDDGSSGTITLLDPTENRFSIALQVGDSYTIQDGRDIKMYMIHAIKSWYLIVYETNSSGRITDLERMLANVFLGEILMTFQQLDSMVSFGRLVETGAKSVNGEECTIYREYRDDDRYWIQAHGSNYIIWQQRDDSQDYETLIDISIAGL